VGRGEIELKPYETGVYGAGTEEARSVGPMLYMHM